MQFMFLKYVYVCLSWLIFVIIIGYFGVFSINIVGI